MTSHGPLSPHVLAVFLVKSESWLTVYKMLRSFVILKPSLTWIIFVMYAVWKHWAVALNSKCPWTAQSIPHSLHRTILDMYSFLASLLPLACHTLSVKL